MNDHWSWEGRDKPEQIEWERDLFRDRFDAQNTRMNALEMRIWDLEQEIKRARR